MKPWQWNKTQSTQQKKGRIQGTKWKDPPPRRQKNQLRRQNHKGNITFPNSQKVGCITGLPWRSPPIPVLFRPKGDISWSQNKIWSGCRLVAITPIMTHYFQARWMVGHLSINKLQTKVAWIWWAFIFDNVSTMNLVTQFFPNWDTLVLMGLLTGWGASQVFFLFCNKPVWLVPQNRSFYFEV
jgi:hypothetical protein